MSASAATASSNSGRLPPTVRSSEEAAARVLRHPCFPRAIGERGPAVQDIPRLCFLTLEPGTLQTRSSRFDTFFQTLCELGYADEESIIIDYLSAADHGERFPDLVTECLRRRADITVPSTTPAAQIAKKATSTVPIVMIALGDRVATGLVTYLVDPIGRCR
jgi:hypothetical protein